MRTRLDLEEKKKGLDAVIEQNKDRGEYRNCYHKQKNYYKHITNTL